MTEETLKKAVELEKRLYELYRALENSENAIDFDEMTLQMRRAGVQIAELNFNKIKAEATELINKKLQEALKELEAL